ncbi:hypothetical protein L5515_000469 [Caenorhabditis briggsae]|uniref:Uncharacterized protein n=1 Tax=Caenorhabditis briggsae TaxID=6238 RepID=A0AAE9DZT7_CAEBR|nr:hypothetical protein L5515_000469 [Caenorhabditis briggsae]
MLSLLFKNKITEEEQIYLLDKFRGFPQKYEYDITHDVDMKLSIYVGDKDDAQMMIDRLRADGLKFIGQIHRGRPFLECIRRGDDNDHGDADHQTGEPPAKENIKNANPERASSPRPEAEPNIGRALDEMILADSQSMSQRYDRDDEDGEPPAKKRVENAYTPRRTPSFPRPEAKPIFSHALDKLHERQNLSSSQRYVTVDQFEELRQKAQDQLNAFSMDLMSQVQAISATVAIHARSAQNSDTSDLAFPSNSAKPQPMSAQFKAKNELIANGIRCEKCGTTVHGAEPITKLIMAVREHVMTHFDSENPRLKRFKCRECKDFSTNFVDDFEKHLKKHGSMTGLTEKRQKLTANLLTTTHLKLIAKLSSDCFPEVFEKNAPEINTIRAVDTPMRAKASVFPNLDRLCCSKYNIPYSATGRTSLPGNVIKID